MDLIAQVRDLKIRAMDERDSENWEGAFKLLTQARQELEQALKELPVEPAEKDSKLLKFETDAKKALYGLWGSIGGVYRRRAASGDKQPADLEDAIKSYDRGREIEKAFTDSYNLTQRLVMRVLLVPGATADESVTVERENLPGALRDAKAIIDEQTGATGPRNKDEYAFADAAIVALLLGESRWKDALNEFTRQAPKSSYARAVTMDVLKELEAAAARGGEAAAPLRERTREAIRLASL
jgi:hypothetical protein